MFQDLPYDPILDFLVPRDKVRVALAASSWYRDPEFWLATELKSKDHALTAVKYGCVTCGSEPAFGAMDDRKCRTCWTNHPDYDEQLSREEVRVQFHLTSTQLSKISAVSEYWWHPFYSVETVLQHALPYRVQVEEETRKKVAQKNRFQELCQEIDKVRPQDRGRFINSHACQLFVHLNEGTARGAVHEALAALTLAGKQ